MGDSSDNSPTLNEASLPVPQESLHTLPPEVAPRDTPTVGLDSEQVASAFQLTSGMQFGDYELLEEIARGGMGIIFRARQISLNRIVALKMILAGRLASATDRLRFKAEAEAAASLEHPNILPIYEVGEKHGHSYFSMKLVEGGNLAESMGDFVNEPVRTCRLMVQLARGVHYAHLRGILHRDLKPANILLASNLDRESGIGNRKSGKSNPGSRFPIPDSRSSDSPFPIPQITDFGLAKRAESDSDLTRSGVIVGTPSYMAPEQARAQKQLTTAVDIYSLGAIFYEMLTGQVPFDGDSVIETLRKVIDTEPVSPRKLNPKIDRDLGVIAMKCLEKDPLKRYESAGDLADDLERWLGGEPILARPSSAFEKGRKWARRHPAIASLSVLCVLLVIGGYLFTWYQLQAVSQARHEAEVQKQIAQDQMLIAEAKSRELQISQEQVKRELYEANLLRGDLLAEQGDLDHAEPILWRAHLEPIGEPDQRPWWRLWGLYRDAPRLTGIAFRGSSETSKNLEVSPDGSKIVIVEGDQLRLCWARNGELIEEWKSPHGEVNTLHFTPDGRHLAIGHTHDGVVTVIPVENPAKPVAEFRPIRRNLEPSRPGSPDLRKKGLILEPERLANATVIARRFIDNTRLMIVEGAEVGWWDFAEQKWTHLADLPPLQRRQSRQIIGAIPGESHLLIQFGFQLELWRLPLKGHSFTRHRLVLGGAESLREIPINDRGASGGRTDLKEIEVLAVAMSDDGRFLVTQERNGRFRLWDFATKRKIGEGERFVDPSSVRFEFSSDQQQLLRIGETIIEILQLPDLKVVRTINRLGSRTDFARLLPNRVSLVLSETRGVGIYDLTASSDHRIICPTPTSGKRAIGPSGPMVGIPSKLNAPVEFWENGQKREFLLPERDTRNWLDSDLEVLSPDGRYLALSSSSLIGASVRVIDLKEGKSSEPTNFGRDIIATTRSIFHLAFSPDSKKLIACTDRGIYLLDAAKPVLTRPIKLPRQTIIDRVSAQFSPDSKQIAVAVLQSERALEDFFKPSIWNVWILDATTEAILQRNTSTFQGTILGWTANGEYLVTRTDEKVTLWNPQTLEPIRDFTESVRTIHSFSPDASKVLFVKGTRLRIWDVARNELLLKFDPEVGLIRSAIFSADGKGLRILGDRRTIEIRIDAVQRFLDGNRLWQQTLLRRG